MTSVWGISKVLVLLRVNFPAVMLWLLKIFVQNLWNEAEILTGSSGVVCSSEQSMVLPNMFYLSILLASACTPQHGHSRDTESTLPVGSSSLGLERASAKSAFGRKKDFGRNLAWVASTSEIFLLYPMESHWSCPGCISKCLWTPTEVGIDSSFHLGLHIENVDCGR